MSREERIDRLRCITTVHQERAKDNAKCFTARFSISTTILEIRTLSLGQSTKKRVVSFRRTVR